MQKTKLGISVGLLGALLYFSGLFSGYVITILVAGYVLLVEDNPWIRRTAVKAVALMIGFSFLTSLIGIIPDCISVINNIAGLFDEYFTIEFLSKLCNLLTSIVNLIELIIFLALGVKSLNQGSIHIPVIDNLLSKYMD